MGDEADALEGFSDEGAHEALRELDREQRYRQRIFKNAVQFEVAKQLQRAGVVQKPYAPRGVMLERVCKCGCGAKFQARQADVKRGWGRFASKSCAATFKDKRTRGRNRDHYGY